MVFSNYICKYSFRCVEIISFGFSVKSAGTLHNVCDCSWPAWTLSLSNSEEDTAQF